MNLNEINDGVTDATGFIQKMLDNRVNGKVFIPAGRYRITAPLVVHSDTYIEADSNAVLYMCGDTPKDSTSFLLTTDTKTKTENVRIRGGIWDGNNQGKFNTKGDIFRLDGYSGAVLNFFDVRGLELYDMVVSNSVTYNIRMARISDFRIENISFVSDKPAFNQDGLHFNGNCRNGVIRNIRALSKGQTNDDLIALNADDEMKRVENVGMERGDIENLLIENVYAENCHTLVRLLSVDHSIRNVTLRNIYGGYRYYAVNADAARYCRTPLFDDSNEPAGVGNIENVLIENMTCYSESSGPAVIVESLCNNFQIKNFRFLSDNGYAAEIKNLTGTTVKTESSEYAVMNKNDRLQVKIFNDMTIEKA